MKDRYVKYFVRLLFVVAFIGLVIAAAYLYYQNREITGKNNEAATKRLVKKISKFMILPEGLPTLATVTDKTKINNQPFFKDAENGDKVLIYPESQKVILYRPSNKKVIEVANASAMINTENQDALMEQQPDVVQEELRVVIYNGTGTSGLSNTVEDGLVGKINKLKIEAKTVASKTDYTETRVIDISNKSDPRLGQIANIVNGKIDSLPEGEKKPDADILIIIGQK